MKTTTRRLATLVYASISAPVLAQNINQRLAAETQPPLIGGYATDLSEKDGGLGDRYHAGTTPSDSGSISSVRVAQAEGVRAARSSKDDRKLAALEEVVVTAQRRAERSIDVPMTVTALPGNLLSSLGVNNALDLSFVVPGMSVAEPSPGMQMIVIRGISSLRGSSSLMSTYLDEIPSVGVKTQAFTGAPDLRVVDIDRVEVLKGPQGTLFGEGAAGGVVRYITKDPVLSEFGGSVEAEFSDTADGGQSKVVTGVLNAPLVKDVLGIRIAAQYIDQAGWIDQPSIGREDINDSEVKHLRVKALFQPFAKLAIRGLAEIHRNDGGANNIVNRYPLRDSNFLQAVDPFAPTAYEDEYDMMNVALTYDFGFAELLSSSSYVTSEGTARFTQVTPEQPTPFLELDIEGWNKLEMFNQEVRLTSATGESIEWIVGANYKEVDTESDSLRGLSLRLNGGPALRGLGANRKGQGASDSFAIFADIRYEVLDGLKIGGGVRYFEDERASSVVPGDVGKFSKPTYRLFAGYELTQQANIYASWGTGFRSGSFNSPFSVSFGAPATYQPDESKSYELGLKVSGLDGRLRLDAAVYYGEYENMQEDIATTCDCVVGAIQYTANGQDAEIRGVELSLDWNVSDRLTVGLAGDVTDTEVTYIDPSYVTHAYNIGDPLYLVADYNLSTRAAYSFQWSNEMPGIFQLSYNRKGPAQDTARHRYGGAVLTDHVVSSELNFLNASIGGDWNTWQWSLFGRNLLDEREAIMPGITGVTPQARPRTFGISLRKTF